MKTNADFDINQVIKYALITLAAIVVLVILMALTKIWFVYSTFGYFTYKISSVFGTDLMLSRVVAAMATVGTLILIPWIMAFLFFGKKKKEILYATVIIGSVCFLGVYFGTGNVFFDRTTGKPARYYVKTLEGFKFSMNADFDSKFGIKYKPIDGEIVKEYLFWEKFGKQRELPEVKPGVYFDRLTGEPVVWYIEKFGVIYLFSLPGHDPATGRALKPMTQEVADRIEEQKRAKEDEARKRLESRSMSERVMDCMNLPEKRTSLYSTEFVFDSQSDQLVGKWYQDETRSIDFARNWLPLNHHGLFFNQEHSTEVYVEKALFIEPTATIVGVCYRGIKSPRMHLSGFIVDAKGVRHDPSRIYAINKQLSHNHQEGYYINLEVGITTRVLYVLEYVSPEDMVQGEFFGSWTGQSLKFSKRN